MAGSRVGVTSVVSVSDPRLASKVGTRTWGTILLPRATRPNSAIVSNTRRNIFLQRLPL